MRTYADTRRSVKYAVICAGAGVLAALSARSTWLGVPVALAFFGLAGYLVRAAIARTPRLTVDEEGLGGAALPRDFAWAELDSIEHTTCAGRYRPDQVLRVAPHEGPPFEVVLSNLSAAPATILDAVRRFHDIDDATETRAS